MSLSLAVILLWSVLGMSVRKVIVRFKSSDNIKDTLGKVSLVDYHSALLKLCLQIRRQDKEPPFISC